MSTDSDAELNSAEESRPPQRPARDPERRIDRRSLLRAGDGPMVTFEGVTKRYGSDVLGLDDVTVSIDAGEFVFLVGASGIGEVDLHPPADQGARRQRGHRDRRRP